MYDYTAHCLQQFQINLNLSHIAPNTWFHGLGALVAPWESLKVLRIEYLPHRGGNHGNLQVLNSATGMIWNDGMMSVYVCSSLHFTLKNMDLYGSFGFTSFCSEPYGRFSSIFSGIPTYTLQQLAACTNWELKATGDLPSGLSLHCGSHSAGLDLPCHKKAWNNTIAQGWCISCQPLDMDLRWSKCLIWSNKTHYHEYLGRNCVQ